MPFRSARPEYDPRPKPSYATMTALTAWAYRICLRREADLIEGIVVLWRALQAGNERRIYELSLPISSLVGMQNDLDSFLAVEKHLLVRHGIVRNTIGRGPVGYRRDEETWREVDRLFGLLNNALTHENDPA